VQEGGKHRKEGIGKEGEGRKGEEGWNGCEKSGQRGEEIGKGKGWKSSPHGYF